MNNEKTSSDSLTDVLTGVPHEILVDLIETLIQNRPGVRSDCFEYLKKHVTLTPQQQSSAEGDLVMELWGELLPDLEELDNLGGGSREMENNVYDLMHKIEQKLNSKLVDEDIRRDLLEEILPFIVSGNAGMDDSLYELAYAACYTDENLHVLAQAFEAMNADWPRNHAMRIYRKLGDRDKYLELRHKKLIYGGDYYDLATFYWDEGDPAKALSVAEEGMEKGQGRMDELRQFLSDRAREGGNREKYLELQFESAIEYLTLEKYKAFKSLCTEEEWKTYDGKLLQQRNRIRGSELVGIFIYREEYKLALDALLKIKYPEWESDPALQVAKQLESRFPEKILAYYLSGFNGRSRDTTRSGYAARARIMLKIRGVLLDVLKDEARWKQFARPFKLENRRRPALQDEFGNVIPDWRNLG
jgi:hypothetical protein